MKTKSSALLPTLVLAACGVAAGAFAQVSTSPVVTVRVPDPGASEAGDPGVFVISREGATDYALSVFFRLGGSASNGVDFAEIPGSIVIPVGHRAVEIPVRPVDDSLAEGDETVGLQLVPSLLMCPGLPCGYAIGWPATGAVLIHDNDGPAPTNRPPHVELVSPLAGSLFLAPVNVHLAAKAGDPDPGDYVASVEFFSGTNSLGVDFAPPFGLIWSNVPPGRYEVRAIARDTKGAPGFSQWVHFTVVTNLPPPPTNLHTLVTIQALDGIAAEGTNSMRWTNFCSQPFTNFCGTNSIQREGTNTARFLVRRHGPTNNALVVHYRIGGLASNGVDYAQLPGLVEIPAGQRGAEIVLVPIDDLRPEPLENVIIGLRPPPNWSSNTPPPYVIGVPARAAAVIVDNDGPRPPHHIFPDRCFHFVHPGMNGTWVRIESSTNMIHWTSIGVQQVSDGAVHFVDPDGDGRPSGFYRVVPSAPPAEN